MKAFTKIFKCPKPGCGTEIVVKGTIDEKGSFVADYVFNIPSKWGRERIEKTAQWDWNEDAALNCENFDRENIETGEVSSPHVWITVEELRNRIGRG